MKKSSFYGVLFAFLPLTACGQTPTINVPDGFKIEVLNFSVPGARQMALTANGTLIVGTRRQGDVYAIPNALTHDAPKVAKIMSGLSMPSGLTVHEGDLYIAALDEVIRIKDIESNYTFPDSEYITQDLPDERHHGWKYIKFGPDGMLYVPVGAPCNICLSEDERFASILRMDPNTGATEVWAEGVRNTVGFDWHPETSALWFSDNGRDMMGDDIPAEEINISTKAGQHFGYPFVHAGDIEDPEFSDHKDRPTGQIGPEVKIQAHSAALGMDFYTGSQFPDSYTNAVFIAEHGSWNRTKKVGYQVSVVMPSGEYKPFATGWLVGQDNSGRPNDVLMTPDGALLISDDQGGLIYRVTYASDAS